MKQLGCRDLGVSCGFVATGNTDEEIKNAAWAHAGKAHPDMMKGMTPDKKKEMNAKMDALLKRPVPAPAGR